MKWMLIDSEKKQVLSLAIPFLSYHLQCCNVIIGIVGQMVNRWDSWTPLRNMQDGSGRADTVSKSTKGAECDYGDKDNHFNMS